MPNNIASILIPFLKIILCRASLYSIFKEYKNIKVKKGVRRKIIQKTLLPVKTIVDKLNIIDKQSQEDLIGILSLFSHNNKAENENGIRKSNEVIDGVKYCIKYTEKTVPSSNGRKVKLGSRPIIENIYNKEYKEIDIVVNANSLKMPPIVLSFVTDIIIKKYIIGQIT